MTPKDRNLMFKISKQYFDNVYQPQHGVKIFPHIDRFLFSAIFLAISDIIYSSHQNILTFYVI